MRQVHAVDVNYDGYGTCVPDNATGSELGHSRGITTEDFAFNACQRPSTLPPRAQSKRPVEQT